MVGFKIQLGERWTRIPHRWYCVILTSHWKVWMSDLERFKTFSAIQNETYITKYIQRSLASILASLSGSSLPFRQPVLSFSCMVSFCKYKKIHTYLSYRKNSIQYTTYSIPLTIYITYVHWTPRFFHHALYLDITPYQCVEISVISFPAAEGSLL